MTDEFRSEGPNVSLLTNHFKGTVLHRRGLRTAFGLEATLCFNWSKKSYQATSKGFAATFGHGPHFRRPWSRCSGNCYYSESCGIRTYKEWKGMKMQGVYTLIARASAQFANAILCRTTLSAGNPGYRSSNNLQFCSQLPWSRWPQLLLLNTVLTAPRLAVSPQDKLL